MTFMTSSNEILFIVIVNNDKCQTIRKRTRNKIKIASNPNNRHQKKRK